MMIDDTARIRKQYADIMDKELNLLRSNLAKLKATANQMVNATRSLEQEIRQNQAKLLALKQKMRTNVILDK